VVRASDNPPSTGPAGYSAYTHIWSTYIDGSGNLRNVIQRGNRFIAPLTTFNPGGTASSDGSPVALDISSAVPVSAGEFLHLLRMDCNADADFCEVKTFADSGGTLYGAMSAVRYSAEYNEVEATVPILSNSQQIYYQRLVYAGDLNNMYIYGKGWVDESIEG
jgi:hypothetical protein